MPRTFRPPGTRGATEIFDTAASVGELLETAALRGQIARFLHKYNSLKKGLNGGCKSRLDDEGGAVPDGLPR